MPFITPKQSAFFQAQGYLKIPQLLSPEQLIYYRAVYEDFLENRIEISRYRSDLGTHAEEEKAEGIKERITQIMVPSKLVPDLLNKPLHQQSLAIAQSLLGDDMALDFDMLIDKAPFSNTPTPWHQDCAYWIEMPDLRAVSCWVALDKASIDNGCMWYVPQSHQLPMRPHRPAGKGGGALECDASEEEGVAVELQAGDCVLHQGGTLHYSRGNTTAHRRRAFITNFRPQQMIELERAQGYDHTGERELRRK
ncbi:phytanoyl-CoA dioxygenase family protein [Catalinimonas niigatensis]|uniref:phytanoyl-CoA dioxygenase family protein n=1 Tax=Catalinimonas niigatensis TaxID=1397264 RepID=UPI0026666696|nr:phytanoyl-CoA dioxygenase family protein [Catalinimonas niigatensis]WPP53013.1 phytanoyl-CoA dioxygenase family protein [Catalinimonas niigatensis]